MGRTPDRSPGEADEEGIVLTNLGPGNDPSALGGMRYVNGAFRLKDALGVFDPRPSVLWYDVLLEIDPDETATTYTATYSGNTVTQESWSDTGTAFELKRIEYTYTNRLVTTEVRKAFDPANGTTIVAQKTITYAYTNFRVTGMTVVRNV
jgi:hypothetical protein